MNSSFNIQTTSLNSTLLWLSNVNVNSPLATGRQNVCLRIRSKFKNHEIETWHNIIGVSANAITDAKCKGPFVPSVSVNAAMMLVIPFSLIAMESLQNGM